MYVVILFIAISYSVPFCRCHDDNTRLPEKPCFPFESCKTNETSTCRCDEKCGIYGDCCYDSPHRKTQMKKVFICRKGSQYEPVGVYAKAVCPRRNVRRWIRENCEGAISWGDIELQVPAFSPDTLVTYRNYYCALCNNDTNGLLFWDIEFSCPSIGDIDVKRNVIYNDTLNEWGVFDFGTWIRCTVSFHLTEGTSRYRECVSSKSHCRSQTPSSTLQSLCNSYESRLYSENGAVYKNLHCALCNNVNVEGLKCAPFSTGLHFSADVPPVGVPFAHPTLFEGRPKIVSLNFAELFNFNKGNRMEKENSCPKGHVHNRYKKTCEKVFCLFNRIPCGGKCVIPEKEANRCPR